MGTHQKLNYIHVFRALAIMLIVASHCARIPNHTTLKPLLNVLLRDGTVLFVFISGFLFQYLSDNFSYGNYLKKKFLNVISPYLVTSIIGIVFLFFYPSGNPFYELNKLLQIPLFLTTGYYQNLPTWYIPMTCVFFLCAAGLLKAENIKIFNGKSLLFCALAGLLCLSLFIPRLPLGFSWETLSAWQCYTRMVGTIALLTVLFFPIYILGMFMAAHRDYIPCIYKYRNWWILGLLLTGLLSFTGLYLGVLSGRLLAPKIILTLIVLGYLEHYDAKIMKCKRINSLFDILATYSFAIFFFHSYLIRVEHRLLKYLIPGKSLVFSTDLTPFTFMAWLGLFLGEFLLVLSGSLLMCMLAKMILTKLGIKHTRYFIGV